MNAGAKSPSREHVASMFDSIGKVYDFINRVISFGSDPWFRRVLVKTIPTDRPITLIDIATGTCDQLLSALRRRPNITKAFGIDISKEMLKVGQKKVIREGWEKTVTLTIMDAEEPTFNDNSFDIATLSFGIRNFKDPQKGLHAIYRILKPAGSIHILEFSTPTLPIFRPLFLFYIRHVLPFLAGLFTTNKNAYHYLNETIESFAQRDSFCSWLQTAGFHEVHYRSYFLGIVTIYTGKKS